MASRYNEYNTFQGSGAFNFNGRYSGFDQADYVLGLMSSFNQSNGEIEFRRYHYYGFYGADTFRLTRRLTLTYGLRWEPYIAYKPSVGIANGTATFIASEMGMASA